MSTVPLPEHSPVFRPRWPGDVGGYTEEQLRAYGAACATAERERCAKTCEEIVDGAWALWKVTADPNEQGRSIGAEHCADAIRNMEPT